MSLTESQLKCQQKYIFVEVQGRISSLAFLSLHPQISDLVSWHCPGNIQAPGSSLSPWSGPKSGPCHCQRLSLEAFPTVIHVTWISA